MSRCFPYPPPGFELKKTRVNDLDVIESIKREKEKAKKERKKEKKEKKEKKKKDKSGENGEIRKKDRSEKKRQKLDNEAGNVLKRKEEESEQLEKSCLTEEQLATTQNLYDSSDSTQNSNKRKRQSSLSNGNHINGSSLFIRLPLLKHKEPELPPSKENLCSTPGRSEITALKKDGISSIPTNQLPSSKENLCSTSGRSEITALKKDGIFSIPTNQLPPSKDDLRSTSGRSEITAVKKDGISSIPTNQQACSTSGRNEIPVHDKAVTAPIFSSSKKGSLLQGSPFIDLIENWIPPTLQHESMDFDDQEWLFETKQYHGHEAKRIKPSEEESCQRSSSLWPRACYLPDIDTYILPYTVPF